MDAALPGENVDPAPSRLNAPVKGSEVRDATENDGVMEREPPARAATAAGSNVDADIVWDTEGEDDRVAVDDGDCEEVNEREAERLGDKDREAVRDIDCDLEEV